jgi:hypothetical protein
MRDYNPADDPVGQSRRMDTAVAVADVRFAPDSVAKLLLRRSMTRDSVDER